MHHLSLPQQPQARYVAMKDSWSHGEDRRDRGRVDRGVTRARSRSPPPPPPTRRGLEGDRERERDRERVRDPKPRDRSLRDSRPRPAHHDRPRDHRSPDRRRRRSRSRSPLRDSRDEVRERNRGRELLEPRSSEKPRRSSHHSPSSKRRKSRSPSPRGHKKPRRDSSRSPPHPRPAGGSRHDKKHRPLSPLPPRRSSPGRKALGHREDHRHRHHRDSEFTERRGRSPSPGRGRRDSRQSSTAHRDTKPKPDRSPHRSPPRHQKPRERSPAKIPDSKPERVARNSRASPEIDRYESFNPSHPPSPRAPASPKGPRGSSPRRDREDHHPRDEYRPGPGKPGKIKGNIGRPIPAASGANSIEVKRDKMAHRGYYGGHQGYNPNQQMQAAFPLKPQYNQGPPQVDPRQYSQSPQHQMTPNSYHSSPQAQSPYGAGRGNWGGQQQAQYSPQPQYPQNHQQQAGFSPQSGPQSQYYNNAQSSPYQSGPTGPTNNQYPQHNNFQRGGRGFRGNNNYNSRGRGGRGGHFNWNNQGGNLQGAGRGQHNNSGNVTPQHASPPQQYPSQYPGSHEGSIEPAEEEDADDLFRPSKELQVEDKEEAKKKDEEQMPPPTRPTPTGPQAQQNSSKFSFAFKTSSKNTPTPPKPEISQKLNAAPSQPPERSRGPPPSSRIPLEPLQVPDRQRSHSGRSIPTEPASGRRQDFREPAPPKVPAPTVRKVKKIMKRPKPRPQLADDLKKSDSVYYRKPGNESVVGSGTYGKVFKAVHVYTKDLVALKKIRMEGERDGFPVTAVREIKLLQSLKHPNVVNLQEVMVEKNDCFMVFEYLSHDLTGLLNHPTFKLEPAHKKHLAKQLFEGLDYLHRRGVLHRDIKAANILVSNDGQLKLADFGLARFYAKRRQLDYTNRVITIWYRSPELLLGETQYGSAVDIWSAACVLVEIFTRHAIFPGDGGEISQLEKIYAILGTPNKAEWPGLVDMAWFELLRPTARRPNVFAEKYKDRVTPAAYELLEAMFQYDPAKRPNASDVLEHPYFTTEEPKPRQATELSKLDGDWHEFESKALRKENERKEKEARRLQKDKGDKDKKRVSEDAVEGRDSKRINSGMGPPPAVPGAKAAVG